MNALQRVIEERPVGDADAIRQGGIIDAETVILRGDQHGAVIQVLHRMVGAVMAMPHLGGLHSGSQAE